MKNFLFSIFLTCFFVGYAQSDFSTRSTQELLAKVNSLGHQTGDITQLFSKAELNELQAYYQTQGKMNVTFAGADYSVDGGAATAYGVETAALLGFVSFDPGSPAVLTTISSGSGTTGFEGAGAISNDDPSVGYAIDTNGVLYSIDVETGAYTNIGNIGILNMNGMEFAPSGTLYANDATNLYTINTATQTATLVGPMGAGVTLAVALAIDGDGVGYTYDLANDSFYSINLATGAATLVGPIGFDANFGQGMAWDASTDAVYMSAFNGGTFQPEWRSVNTATGATTLIGVINPGTLSQVAWVSIIGENTNPPAGDCDLEGEVADPTLGGPVWDRPLEDGSGMSAVGVGVPYHVYGPFTVDTSGSYEINSVQAYDGFIFVYETAFDPADPLTNYHAGDDDFGTTGLSQIITDLDTGTEYFLITTSFSSTDFGTFTNTITGPGTVTCGTVDPPADGCLEAENGQYPTTTYVPACLGMQEDITTLAWTGEYSVVQVENGTEYTFSVSDPTYFITIGDATGTTVLGSGTGSLTWTSTLDGEVRFYTHFTSDCDWDATTFLTRSVMCGEPVIITEPDFPCFQGDGLESNGPEDGLNISLATAFRNADDFIVTETFTVQQVRMNVLSMSEISEMTLNFRTDDGGSPSATIQETVTMAPTEQRIVGAAFGFNAYEVTFDLPTAFEFGAGTYWLQPEAVNGDPADGAIYWEATSTGSNGAISQTSEDSGSSWMPNEFGYQLVFFVAGECGTNPGEDCEVIYDGTFVDGLGDLSVLQVANDFTVPANTAMSIDQVRVNLFSNVTTASVYIYADAGGAPGALLGSGEGLTPTSQTFLSVEFGFNTYEIVLDLPTEIVASNDSGSEGIFWVGITTTLGSEGTQNYWEAADATTNAIANVSTDGGITWVANSFGQDGAFIVSGTCGDLGVSEMSSFDFAYYPNPVKDELNITSAKLVESVSVYNLAGQQVSTQKLNVTNGKISTSALAPGVYVFRAVLQGGQVETFKIIKK